MEIRPPRVVTRLAHMNSRYGESRYSRQILVAGIGERGQESIMNGRAVVVGLGALGSTIANILARAGVGTLRLVDRDFVDWTNLQRQGLYDEADAGYSLPKAVAAREHLFHINSEINYEAMVDDVNPGNVENIVSGASVVVDGLDNFYTRALIYVMTSSICGRNAVQVLPDASRVFSFESTLRVLSEAFSVEFNQYLLRLRCGEHEIVLFRDGRAIVFGTSDPKVAKSLYARYIGG